MMSENATIYHVSLYCKTRHKKFAYRPKKKKSFLTNRRALPLNKCGFREMLTRRYNRV